MAGWLERFRSVLGRARSDISTTAALPLSAAPVETPRKIGRLRQTDHAFLSGGVFKRPRDLAHAIEMTGSAEDGQLLCDVWAQFDSNGLVHDDVMLALNARMINDQPDRSFMQINGPSVLRCLIRQEAQGRVDIGRYVYVGDNSLLHAMAGISIGDHTLIAHNVNILDNDTHPIGTEQRQAHFQHLLGMKTGVPFHIERAPIRVGHHCWIGLNSVILKGVTIGDETIVAAGSIVTKSLPPGVLAAGCPARPIKSLKG